MICGLFFLEGLRGKVLKFVWVMLWILIMVGLLFWLVDSINIVGGLLYICEKLMVVYFVLL